MTQQAKTVRERFSLEGRVCVVTGSEGFLGKHYVAAIKEAGGIPVSLDSAGEPEFKVDITSEQALKEVIEQIMVKYGRIDVLINNAAMNPAVGDKNSDKLFAPVEDYPVELLVRWYGQRWQAELHFRSVKTQMQMAELDVCSPEMARKEFYAGLLAYNLVRTLMWAAGERLEEKLQVLSFSDARREVLSRLKDWGRRCASGSGTTQRWVRLLIAEVARQTLPKRRKQRPSEIRRVRHRRQKFPPLTGSRAAARARDFATKSL